MFLLNQSLIHAPSAGKVENYPFLDNLKIADVHLVLIPWNIFLALVPAILGAYILKRWSSRPLRDLSRGNSIRLGALLLLWLLFFPNSIYLITEARKILVYAPQGLPYNASVEYIWKVFMIFTYSLFGWIGFAISLGQIRRFIARVAGKTWSVAITVGLVPLGTLGTFLGLFNRWNIWEAATHPAFIVRDAIDHLTDPPRLKNIVVICAFLYLLYLIGELWFRLLPVLLSEKGKRRERADAA
ncbi:MAG: DUF1361 domain-containing protein [Candidatus Euphemobacter frigidus]|nr:DUF1361 domain-containing protein [Candidatus Euphemobacter frigidus]MDP8276316.1 DUF1361 domain-containing protein [Candidatus Euphemobacter frigidus]